MIETLYVMTPGVCIRLDGGLLILEQNEQILKTLPITTVENLVLGRTVQLSTQAIFSLIQQGSFIQFVDHKYQLVGTLGENQKSLPKLLWQTKNFQKSAFSLEGAKYIVRHKVAAQLAVLEQYKKSRDISNLDSIRRTLNGLLKRIDNVKTLETLRGIEGLASKTYFSLWSSMLSAPWYFGGRKRNPSPNPVNAILSYGYSFLEREVRACLLTVGLDVRIGVLHSTNNRKDSFVYDVMDLLRQSVMDRFILKVLNRRMINSKDFIVSENGYFLSKEANRNLIQIYEEYMTTSVKRFKNLTPRQWIRQETIRFISYLEELSGIDESVNVRMIS